MQQQRRCQSQILLKSKYKISNKEKSENTRDSPDLLPAHVNIESKQPSKTSDNIENIPLHEEDSNSEEEDEDDGVDPDVKEKERKTSEQRIMQIVHYDGPLEEKGSVLPSDGMDGSNTNTPTAAHKINKGKISCSHWDSLIDLILYLTKTKDSVRLSKDVLS